MQTDCIGGCEKKDNTERSQALLVTTNLFRKLRREESAAEERTKSKKLLIFARLLLPYRENGCAIYLPFSIGTVQPYRKNGTAVVRLVNNGGLWCWSYPAQTQITSLPVNHLLQIRHSTVMEGMNAVMP